MRKFQSKIVLALLLFIVLTSCEHVTFDDNVNGNKPSDKDANLVFNIDEFNQIPFGEGINVSRAGTPVDQVCTRIDLAIFDNNSKIAKTSQQIGDEGFGKIGVNVPDGSYQVVIIAHNSNGQATISSPDKITFPNNKVTDTFYFYANISVDGSSEYTIQMKRAVAKFQLITEGYLPENTTTMKFYYTGGSSTFNAVTGFGCVNSRQTELRDIDTTNQYEVYTFPHDETGQLKMTVSALDIDGNELFERVFNEVPVQRNVVTRYNGTFFMDEPTQSSSFTLTTNETWKEQIYTY